MTTKIGRHRATAAVILLLASCTNYDFALARKANGEFDVPKLMADLQASGQTQLRQGTWIPLIYLDVTTFGKDDATLPNGYSIQHLKAFGPVFLFGGSEKQILDEKGSGVESWDRSWVGWGLLHRNRDDYVETTHGRRYEGHERVLVFFGSDATVYSPPQR
ncbi:MAG TPA: hypothetical protein VFZ65_02490 [Planctomycetota bacterium]|nr:hypothetical protein [Planctomycetota bacterium]